MQGPLLDTVEVESGSAPAASVIWLHGLGADGHDFEPVVPHFVPPGGRAVRFIFPHAPLRAVTIAGGARIRAWYDITGLDRNSLQDESGVRAADAAVRALVRRENERGVATSSIVLGGFSQGGAMSLYSGTRLPAKLAGVIGLSCYMLLGASFAAERQAANQNTPIFMAHGMYDPVVAPLLGELAQTMLSAAGYAVEWHRYQMAHELCAPEIEAIAAFLRRVL
jgi:phospholipase/carboxylesterase